MALTLMPMPSHQFLGTDGKPLAGGILYTYQPGTLVPKVTYIDSLGSAQNTNPIILDSAGRAQIWLDGAYNMRLFSSTNVLQWSIDNVVSGDQTQFAALQTQIDTINTNLSNYAPLTSPALLGTPTAPTANTATSNSQLSTTAFVHNVVDQGVTSVTFIGMVTYFAMPVAPSGWLSCDGSAYSRTIYANLFSVIGTTFGIGDGVNTFNVPNMKNKIAEGWDQIKSFGTTETVLSSGTNGLSNIILLPCIKA